MLLGATIRNVRQAFRGVNAFTDMKERLLKILKEKSLVFEKVRLSSGKESNYYIDAKLTTLDPEGSTLVASIFLDMIKDIEVDAVGGYILGADPIVGSIITLSHLRGIPVSGFIVRKEPKKHGRQKLIEGILSEGAKVVIVDDIVTTGSSLKNAISAVEEAGGKVLRVLCIVDRDEGGREALQGYDFKAIFSIKELLR